MDEHEALVERAVREAACVLLMGGLDSGKTTLGRAMVSAACEAGTTAAFIDNHEMANVFGLDGIRWMLEEGRKLPLKVFLAVPSIGAQSVHVASGPRWRWHRGPPSMTAQRSTVCPSSASKSTGRSASAASSRS